ncbi:hypothetical protein [Caulobacter sp.]|uniref:hypothetical protein n=1 Tax=Caulobacter sp. TaxID=78 RepID=UPI00161EDBA5
MSKSRSKSAPRKTAPITEASSALEVMRANLMIRMEIIRREAYAEHQALRQQLAETPPVPATPLGDD